MPLDLQIEILTEEIEIALQNIFGIGDRSVEYLVLYLACEAC